MVFFIIATYILYHSLAMVRFVVMPCRVGCKDAHEIPLMVIKNLGLPSLITRLDDPAYPSRIQQFVH